MSDFEPGCICKPDSPCFSSLILIINAFFVHHNIAFLLYFCKLCHLLVAFLLSGNGGEVATFERSFSCPE